MRKFIIKITNKLSYLDFKQIYIYIYKNKNKVCLYF